MNKAESDEEIASSTPPTVPAAKLSIDHGGPILAYVEVDRYCPHCAYNLRTQPVRRDGPTRLLVARCPECGAFDAVANAMTATKPWLSRLAMLGLLLWIIALLWSIFGLSFAQGAVNYVTLEEFTFWQQGPASSPPAGVLLRPYRRVLRPDYLTRDYYFTMSLAIFGSFALAFLLIAMLVVVCHHWRRVVFVCFAVVHTLVVSAFVWEIWRHDVPGLFDWGREYIVAFAIVRLVGALAAVWAGRPLARLTVRIFLPPRIRSVLAFLWLADGLEPPRKETPTDGTDVPTVGA
ncbi:MAG: hypothetical protein IID34_00760 [Planctomycetes bacterium]|nr:hypothetical protein [Planctomycetota bacterium]